MAASAVAAPERSIAYWRDSARPSGSEQVLRNTLLELLKHVGAEQVRALCYAAGVRIATENPLKNIEKLSDLEAAARHFMTDRGWGWMAVEEHPEWVDLVHGCPPLRAWFGADNLSWSAALFEGFYAEWLRQLGAGERLALRQVEPPGAADDLLRFRLMHESRFKV